MAHFCNQFDRVCSELGAAVIYCHHHSKGTQGQKRSMDRASGSGVFARDPDVLLDLIELDLSNDLLKQEENKAVCAVCETWLEKHVQNWIEEVSQDDRCSEKQILPACNKLLGVDVYQDMLKDVFAARQKVQQRSAWRIEGTLREFPKFKPVNLWFTYPTHQVDKNNILQDVEAEGEKAPWKKNFTKKKTPEQRKKDKEKSLDLAYEACGFNGDITVKNLAEYMGKSEDTIRRHIKENGKYWVDNGQVGRK
jgi:RecA-family ATPase